ncbi:MAG: helix-turn-helix domain-containing protein [Patescibacteria group bacterium]
MARTNVGAAAKSSVRRIRTTEKTLKALELRKRGMNYTQIGEELGCNRSTACRYVLSELENLADKCREEAVHVRDLELQRLDELYLIAYRAISDGNDLAGIDRCLRIMERRAKLLGIDAAAKVDVQGLVDIHFDKEDEDL